MNTTYIPQSNDELLNWLKNFTSHLPDIGKSLGVTPAEVAALNALIVDVKQDIKNNKTDDKEGKKNAMITFLKKLITTMKTHPAYSDEKYGTVLKIV